jgi:hypothetical protein
VKLIYDRQSVGQSVLVSGAHLGPATNFSLSVKFPSDSCRFVIFVEHSLTRGRVCNLLYNCFWALPEQVTLRSKSRRTHGHILMSRQRLPQPGGPGPCIYILQEQCDPVIPPGTGFPFLSPLTTRRDYGGGILTRLHTDFIHLIGFRTRDLAACSTVP